jgi:hypothetical protein
MHGSPYGCALEETRRHAGGERALAGPKRAGLVGSLGLSEAVAQRATAGSGGRALEDAQDRLLLRPPRSRAVRSRTRAWASVRADPSARAKASRAARVASRRCARSASTASVAIRASCRSERTPEWARRL